MCIRDRNTIDELEENLRYLRNKMRKIEVFEDKRARLLNANEQEWIDKLKEFSDANKLLAERNKTVTADHIEITRAYNALHNAGVFAEDQGINIKKHRAKLPENNKWEFKATQTVLESGAVVDKMSWGPKDKKKKK